MDKLSETWMVDGTIDFEAKKYTLLAYLQKVKECFDNTKIYPQLSDLFFHHNNLISFKNNKNFLKDHFPKRLSGIQIENLELIYEEMIADNNIMQEIEEIIQYATVLKMLSRLEVKYMILLRVNFLSALLGLFL